MNDTLLEMMLDLDVFWLLLDSRVIDSCIEDFPSEMDDACNDGECCLIDD